MKPIYKDMLAQTHILIAGKTGSGKSVVINGIIATALETAADDVQFILIDPKRVELVDYKNIPQTIKYASEPDDMVAALEYAMEIVERRFQIMQAAGLKKYTGKDLYVIIDEFADLMTTNGKAVKPLIQRLCQIGRASKCHVLAATQCPLSIVIPTTIKVNFDTVVALKTVSAQHSRNIMDCTGCEKLPPYGKAYYITPKDGSRIVSIPMIDERECRQLVKAQMPVEAPVSAPVSRPASRFEGAERPHISAPVLPQRPRKKTLFERLFG